eukprot:scaffold223514_cov79-Attheya_sp.AAC.2
MSHWKKRNMLILDHGSNSTRNTPVICPPCPRNLVPFTPIHGADNAYGQINKQFQQKSYLDTGINGFPPANPFKVHITFAQASGISNPNIEPFTLLLELDNELSDQPIIDDICTTDEDQHSQIMNI